MIKKTDLVNTFLNLTVAIYITFALKSFIMAEWEGKVGESDAVYLTYSKGVLTHFIVAISHGI